MIGDPLAESTVPCLFPSWLLLRVYLCRHLIRWHRLRRIQLGQSISLLDNHTFVTFRTEPVMGAIIIRTHACTHKHTNDDTYTDTNTENNIRIHSRAHTHTHVHTRTPRGLPHAPTHMRAYARRHVTVVSLESKLSHVV